MPTLLHLLLCFEFGCEWNKKKEFVLGVRETKQYQLFIYWMGYFKGVAMSMTKI